MRVYKWFGLVVLCFAMISCLPNEKSDNRVEDESSLTTENSGFSEFVSGFPEIQLPYYLPNQEAANDDKRIVKEFLNNFFADKKLNPAFETERIAPQITDQLDSSEYFYDSRLANTPGYTALIIRKKTTGNYYYLCTFTSAGAFIDGMCISFTADKNTGNTERTASINEDLSIQIRQQNTSSTKSDATLTRFLEISPEGKILGIQLGS